MRRSSFAPRSSGPPGAAIPAIRELTFKFLPALRAVPALTAKLASGVAPKERTQKRGGPLVLGVLRDPDPAYVHRQLAPATRQELAADDGGDPVRFQKSPDEMGLGRVPGDVDLFHGGGGARGKRIDFPVNGTATGFGRQLGRLRAW